MAKVKELGYGEIAALFERHDLLATPTEVHGLITGLVAAGINLGDDKWLSQLDELLNDSYVLPEPCVKACREMAQAIADLLDDAEGHFELLIPTQELPLDEKLDYLGEWAQSFLVGVGLTQQNLNQASVELQEMIQDISTITQVCVDFEQEDESAEEAYMILYEHLRLGVLLTYEEFGATRSGPSRIVLH